MPLFTLFCLPWLFSGLQPAAPGPRQTPPAAAAELEMAVYLRDCTVAHGRGTDVVVEFINRTAGKFTIPEYIGLERVVVARPGEKLLLAKDVPAAVPLEGHAIGLRCYVPPGSLPTNLAPREDRPLPAGKREVLPGKSLLLKVELPAEAFEVGECSVQAYLVDGPREVTRSTRVGLRCVAAEPRNAKAIVN